MEKHPHPFDDSLKEALRGHRLEPTGKARKAFLDEASAILPAKKGWNNWYLLPILLIFIGAITAIILYLPDADKGTVISSETLSENTTIPALNNSSSQNSSSIKSIETPKQAETTESHQNPQSNKSSNPQTTESINPSNPKSVNPQTSKSLNPSIPKSINPSTPESDSSVFTNDSISRSDIPVPVPEKLEDSVISIPADTANKSLPAIDKQPWKIAGGINYTPELMFNTLEGDKLVNNFGLDLILYHGLISLRTGIGVSVSKGITTNSVEYNDYLGSYNKLDSITFDFNEQSNNFEPKMYMSSEKVWDSIGKEDSTDIIKRYTYLQIPLVLGFDFWQKGKISIGVRIGTTMSVMLASHQLTGAYDPGENLVIGVSQLTPSRVNLNWQAMAGFSASAVLTKRLSIELEPQARYYYGSIYEKSGNEYKPWSIGIRAGIVYKF